MLVQSRKGEPVMDDGAVLFHDEDFRAVGEAMILLGFDNLAKTATEQQRAELATLRKRALDPKLVRRVHDLLRVPAVAAINRELGFGRSGRRALLGRWPKAVDKYLRFREANPMLLSNLVRAGYTNAVRGLARQVGYKPAGVAFFEALRWRQVQASDGRRTMAIAAELAKAESWDGLSEEAICNKITAERMSFKRVVGLLPKEIGLTRAIMAAAIEQGCLSDKELVIQTPTLEAMGLLEIQDVRQRWETAVRAAEDQRARNIALNVKHKATKEMLQEGADAAVQKAVEEVVRGLRVYFFIDISSSMDDSIAQAKRYIEMFMHSIPLEQLHVAVFNTAGREITIRHRSAKGVQHAFRGVRAGGGTDYGSGVLALRNHAPKQDEDSLFIFVGDEEQYVGFDQQIEQSGLRPMAFGFVRMRNSSCSAVRDTAAQLGIPCFLIDEQTFDDVYAIGRIVRAVVAATPVGQATGAIKRKSLVEQILETKLLQKPVWAA